MPKWTSNRLLLKGDKEELLALKKSLISEEIDTVFDFNAIIPFLKNGEIYVHNIKNYETATWYDWCCEKWGTKWNACEARCSEREENDGYVLEYCFDTVWSMPYGVIEELHKQHPDIFLTIYWCDEDELEDHEVTLGGPK